MTDGQTTKNNKSPSYSVSAGRSEMASRHSFLDIPTVTTPNGRPVQRYPRKIGPSSMIPRPSLELKKLLVPLRVEAIFRHKGFGMLLAKGRRGTKDYVTLSETSVRTVIFNAYLSSVLRTCRGTRPISTRLSNQKYA